MILQASHIKPIASNVWPFSISKSNSINQWNEMRNQRNDQSSQQSIEWIQLSKVSHLNWCLICFACYSFNSINQSSERKKERKCNKQINQQSISLSFVRLSQFNSIQEKKRLKQTIKRTITKHQSFLIHLTNLIISINQSLKWMKERWNEICQTFHFQQIHLQSVSIAISQLNQISIQSINQWNWKKEWFWFGFVSFQLGIDFHSQSNLIPISNQSSQRDEREKWIEREREKWINNQVCFLHSSINQIKSSEMKWINFHSFILFIWSESDFNDDDDVQLIWEWIN